MIQRDFEDVERQILGFGVINCVLDGHPEEAVRCRMTNRPAKRGQDVPFHLQKHIVIVEGTAHGLEFFDCWDLLFLVPILCSDEQCRTANQLIVPFVDNPLRTIPVKKVDC